MGTTVHEVGARRLLETMLDDPDWGFLLADTRKRMTLPDDHPLSFGKPYVDHIGQMWGARSEFRKWPLEQQAVFTRFHAEICEGLISFTDIVVGETPSQDKLRGDNQAKLSDLPDPFRAEVDQEQEHADMDGVLRWSEPIRVERLVGVSFLPPCRLMRQQGINLHHHLPADSAPLEIGFTLPSRTLLHLRDEGAVARWPYGSDTIRLFIASERARAARGDARRGCSNAGSRVRERVAEAVNVVVAVVRTALPAWGALLSASPSAGGCSGGR